MTPFQARPLSYDAPPEPGPGEVLLAPAQARPGERRGLALEVLRHGAAALRTGEGPVRCWVLPAPPTLDDMLACHLARLGKGGANPAPEWQPLAEYASLVREGLMPAGLPMEATLMARYLAALNLGDADLTQSPALDAFLGRWERLAQVLDTAVAAGKDPFRDDLFEGQPGFEREGLFLAQDREVYEGDLARGHRWRIALPGAPQVGAALLLPQPASLLWKAWARGDVRAPGGKGYAFLGVAWEPGQWIFSVDPALRVSLQPLHAALQAAEQAHGAVDRAWFDGARFNHTLVAPPQEGTGLEEARLLGVVRGWLSAREADAKPRPAWLRAAAGALAAAGLVVLGFVFRPHGPAPAPPGARGAAVDEAPTTAAPVPSGPQKRVALLVGTDVYEHWDKLENPVDDARTLGGLLKDRFGYETRLLENPDLRTFRSTLEEVLKGLGEGDQFLLFIAGHGQYRKGSEQGYIVFRDADAQASSGVYSHAELRDLLDGPAVKARQVLLLLDTCFSGAFGSSRGSNAEEVHMDARAWATTQLQRTVRQYVTSGGKEYVPDNSRFTVAVIRKLRSDLPVIGFTDLVKSVNQLAKPQPRYGSLQGTESGAEFVLLRKAE